MNKRIVKLCSKHGDYTHVLERNGYYRCVRCRNDAVIERRRKMKLHLINDAGGKCQNCGYSRCKDALEFHHINPQQKQFALSHRGLTHSLNRHRDEAKKCILLCANCHREVEAGLIKIKIDR